MESRTVRIAEARQLERWDFQPFSSSMAEIRARLERSPYPVVRLRDVLPAGTTGASLGFGVPAEASEGIPIITARDITGYRVTDSLEDVRYLTPQEHEKLAGTQLARGDLVVNLLMRPGVASVYDGNGQANIGARLVRLRLSDQVDPYYLVEYLNSELGVSLLKMASTGSVQPMLTTQALLELPVILPPLAIQRHISQQALQARLEAKRLAAQAEALRTQAQDGFLQNLFGGGS
jgi:hypothetical protein